MFYYFKRTETIKCLLVLVHNEEKNEFIGELRRNIASVYLFYGVFVIQTVVICLIIKI